MKFCRKSSSIMCASLPFPVPLSPTEDGEQERFVIHIEARDVGATLQKAIHIVNKRYDYKNLLTFEFASAVKVCWVVLRAVLFAEDSNVGDMLLCNFLRESAGTVGVWSFAWEKRVAPHLPRTHRSCSS